MESLISDEATARAARDSLLLGLEATGNLMCWVDPQQPPQIAAENMRRLGQMIETLCVVISYLDVAVEKQRNMTASAL